MYGIKVILRKKYSYALSTVGVQMRPYALNGLQQTKHLINNVTVRSLSSSARKVCNYLKLFESFYFIWFI